MDDRKETQLVTNSDCYRAGKTIRPTGIMVHSTGVAQPDPQVFIKSWNQPGKDACVHARGEPGQGDPDPALDHAGLARGERGEGQRKQHPHLL